MSEDVVLDASAVLAWIRREPGEKQVEDALDGGVLSAVNASEVTQKLIQHGTAGSWALGELRDLGVVLTPFTGDDAATAAELWPQVRERGLSLGDRACLALAQRLDATALTADKAWSGLDLAVDIQLIR